MAINKITFPLGTAPITNTHWQNMIDSLLAAQVSQKGAFILSDWASTASAPAIKQGTYISFNNELYAVESSDEAISGTLTSGINYIELTESGGVITAAWVNTYTGYTYKPVYNGWYNTGGDQILFQGVYLSGADYIRAVSSDNNPDKFLLANGTIRYLQGSLYIDSIVDAATMNAVTGNITTINATNGNITNLDAGGITNSSGNIALDKDTDIDGDLSVDNVAAISTNATKYSAFAHGYRYAFKFPESVSDVLASTAATPHACRLSETTIAVTDGTTLQAYTILGGSFTALGSAYTLTFTPGIIISHSATEIDALGGGAIKRMSFNGSAWSELGSATAPGPVGSLVTKIDLNKIVLITSTGSSSSYAGYILTWSGSSYSYSAISQPTAQSRVRRVMPINRDKALVVIYDTFYFESRAYIYDLETDTYASDSTPDDPDNQYFEMTSRLEILVNLRSSTYTFYRFHGIDSSGTLNRTTENVAFDISDINNRYIYGWFDHKTVITAGANGLELFEVVDDRVTEYDIFM